MNSPFKGSKALGYNKKDKCIFYKIKFVAMCITEQ